MLVTSAGLADLGGIGWWSSSYDATPYDVSFADKHQGWVSEDAFLYINTVKLKSQDMTVTFEHPDTVSVFADYVFEVLGPTGTVLTAYVPDEQFDWGGDKYKPGVFKVSVDGETMDPSDVTLPKETGPHEGYPVVIFPVRFGDTGERAVSVYYSYRLKRSFDWYKQAGDYNGFRYDFGPAKFWAGDVGKIVVTLKVVGDDVDELGWIRPSDFDFTADGYRWTWTDVSDVELTSVELRSELNICYGEPMRLSNEFTEVIPDAGLHVRSGPGAEYAVIAKLGKGDRVYVLRDETDPLLKNDKPGEWWLKCRLLDNTEGYVAEIYGGEYLLDSYSYRREGYDPERYE